MRIGSYLAAGAALVALVAPLAAQSAPSPRFQPDGAPLQMMRLAQGGGGGMGGGMGGPGAGRGPSQSQSQSQDRWTQGGGAPGGQGQATERGRGAMQGAPARHQLRHHERERERERLHVGDRELGGQRTRDLAQERLRERERLETGQGPWQGGGAPRSGARGPQAGPSAD